MQAANQAMMAFAQLQSQQQIAKQQVAGQKNVAEIQANNAYAIAELNQGGDGKAQQYQNPDGTISHGLNGGQSNTFTRPQQKTLAQTNIKKIQLETLEIASKIKFKDAQTKTEFQKLLTEVQMTKLQGNNAAYKMKEVKLFNMINNQSFTAKELSGIVRLLPDWMFRDLKNSYEHEPHGY